MLVGKISFALASIALGASVLAAASCASILGIEEIHPEPDGGASTSAGTAGSPPRGSAGGAGVGMGSSTGGSAGDGSGGLAGSSGGSTVAAGSGGAAGSA